MLWIMLWSSWLGSVFAITFKNDYVAPLVADAAETVYTFDGLDPDKPILEILTELFYPPVFAWADWWTLRDMIRNIGIWVFVALLIWAWSKFLLDPTNDEGILQNLKNILYLIVWWILFFGTSWLLWNVIDFGNIQWLTSASGTDSLLDQAENWLILQVIVFLKAMAFFVAIVFLVYYGFKMMAALDDETQRKAAQQWIINVLLALVLIKIIDYLYFIATTWESFGESVTELIVSVSSFLAYFFGIILFLAIVYAGFLFLTSAGNDDNVSNAKKLLKNIVIVMLVIFLFLLVIYQIFADLNI